MQKQSRHRVGSHKVDEMRRAADCRRFLRRNSARAEIVNFEGDFRIRIVSRFLQKPVNVFFDVIALCCDCYRITYVRAASLILPRLTAAYGFP